MKYLLAPLRFLADILRSILALFGINIGDRSSEKVLPAVPKTAREIMAEAYERDAKLVNDVLKPQREMKNNAAGLAVLTYACARNTAERAVVDLSALSQKQQTWLFMLSDSELESIKKGGVLTCMQALKKYDRKSKLEAENVNTQSRKNDGLKHSYDFAMTPSFA